MNYASRELSLKEIKVSIEIIFKKIAVTFYYRDHNVMSSNKTFRFFLKEKLMKCPIKMQH